MGLSQSFVRPALSLKRTWIRSGRRGPRKIGGFHTAKLVIYMLMLRHRFLDALFYAVDGNFHANLKDKPLDDDDVPLSKGAGYFVDEDVCEQYTSTLGPLGSEVSCPRLRELVS